MNTRLVYNYKTADTGLDTRITVLENMLHAQGNETLDDRINAAVNTAKSELQAQIDGAVTTWFENGVPTLANTPASGWSADEQKDVHLGDIYYDTATGFAYRFMAEGTGNEKTYSWGLLKDSDVTKALADSAEALEAIEGCVAIDQEVLNAGHLLVVGDDGMVTTDIPKGILVQDTTGTKTFYLTLDTEGAIAVNELV